MDASYSIFTKFRLKSLVVLFTQSAIFNLPWMLCALSTTNRSFISPCEKISSFYWLAKHWFRCGDSFGRYLRYFNIDQYSDIVFKINNRNVSEDIYTIILSIAIIYFCNRDFPLSVLEKTLLNWKKINQMNPYFWRLL